MKERDMLDRKNFLKRVSLALLGSAIPLFGAKSGSYNILMAGSKKESSGKYPKVPRRKFGKTGASVPCLTHGLMYDVEGNQLILKKGLQWGLDMWDTAASYGGGTSEVGIGKYLSKNPEIRKDLFIVSKASRAWSISQIEDRLQESLKRMNTKYIDLYYGVHGLSNPDQLTPELRRWAESAKKRKLIRYFGFSTHTNMAACLAGAAKLKWIDAVMTTYNYRFLEDKEMQDSIEACYSANIGLVAMKVLGFGSLGTDIDKKLSQRFMSRGFNKEQAKIMAVLDDKRITSACISMYRVDDLKANVAAAMNESKLSKDDKRILNEYARANSCNYCAGCSHICNSIVADAPYVNDIMRYLMYFNSYGDREKARMLFAEIPASVRSKLPYIDFANAEKQCPQGLPIAGFVKEALSKLA